MEKVKSVFGYSFHIFLQVYKSKLEGVLNQPAELCGKSKISVWLLFPQLSAGFFDAPKLKLLKTCSILWKK